MRPIAYCLVVASLTALAWHNPFLFELPLIAAVGLAYWAFFAPRRDDPDSRR